MKFLVTFLMPHSSLDAWMKLPETERKEQDKTMQSEWKVWMEAHAEMMSGTAGVGKPKRITAEGITDARNDLMMYSFIEAESLEAAAKTFEGHPHFGIPGGSIEVMTINTNVN